MDLVKVFKKMGTMWTLAEPPLVDLIHQNVFFLKFPKVQKYYNDLINIIPKKTKIHIYIRTEGPYSPTVLSGQKISLEEY